MILKKRIRNFDAYALGLKEGEAFYIAQKIDESTGIIDFPLEEGVTLLPPVLGAVSRRNARGDIRKLKDKPKEVCYRYQLTRDWHGHYHEVTVPYTRYKREIIPPAAEELTVRMIEGQYFLVSRLLKYKDSENKANCHIVNLFLELFGSCVVLKQDYSKAFRDVPIKRVNWELLPEGESPWERISTCSELIGKPLVKKAFQSRLSQIVSYSPSHIAIGRGGFSGYIVFCFEEKNLYILENVSSYGNATYVFKNEWEVFSQLSKKEILDNNLHHRRIIHRKGWLDDIEKLLKI